MPKQRERPAGFDPMAGIGDQLDAIYGTSNPQGVQDSYPTREIEVAVIQSNPFQPRKEFDQEELEGLAQSLRENKVILPLLVTFRDGAVYCVSGERRLRAARIAGLRTVLCVVRENLTDAQMADLALEENMHRKDLTPLEEAYALEGYMQRNHLTAREVAGRRGLSHTTVNNRLALIRYREIAQAVADGRLTASLAVQIANGLDRPGQTALREELLAILAAGGSLTQKQIDAAIGTASASARLAAAALPPPAPAPPAEVGRTAPDRPPVVAQPAPLPAIPARPAAVPGRTDEGPGYELSAQTGLGAAPAARAPGGASAAPDAVALQPAGPKPADRPSHLQHLQELDEWLARTETTAWIDELPPDMLEHYLDRLQRVQQRLAGAVAAAQARRERSRAT